MVVDVDDVAVDVVDVSPLVVAKLVLTVSASSCSCLRSIFSWSLQLDGGSVNITSPASLNQLPLLVSTANRNLLILRMKLVQVDKALPC